jgi:hypothetical protein
MPRKGPLKVFRTPIGFHDAYVAATSRKAALQAWGAEKDLFASGSAELVTDPKLTKAALDSPGQVIRLARGTVDEHLRAASGGKARRPKPGQDASDPSPPAVSKRSAKPPPRPSRAKLEKAEADVQTFEEGAAADRAKLDKLEAELLAKRKALNTRLSRGADRVQARLEEARNTYEAAMERWRQQ